MPDTTRWTQERVETLIDLACYVSARQLAELLGVTRNAVLGKAHRLGLSLKQQAVSHAQYDAEARHRRHLANRERNNARCRAWYARTCGHQPHEYRPRGYRAYAAAAAPPPLDITFAQLAATTCRWPTVGAGLTQLYCGHATVPAASYCPCHHHAAHYYAREQSTKQTGGRWSMAAWR